MQKFYITPDITGYPGIIVKKDTEATFEGEGVKQTLKDLRLVTHLHETGDKYESNSQIIINLSEGDILVYDEKKGYKLPGIPMQSAKEIAEDFEALI